MHVFMPQKFTAGESAQDATLAVQRHRSVLDDTETMVVKTTLWPVVERPSAVGAYALPLMRWGGQAGIDPTTRPLPPGHGRNVFGFYQRLSAWSSASVSISAFTSPAGG